MRGLPALSGAYICVWKRACLGSGSSAQAGSPLHCTAAVHQHGSGASQIVALPSVKLESSHVQYSNAQSRPPPPVSGASRVTQDSIAEDDDSDDDFLAQASPCPCVSPLCAASWEQARCNC